MNTLDMSIVNVAMPALKAAFHTTFAVSEWFVLSYTLVITILLLTFGRLGDLFGRRRLYVTGTLVFAAGSLSCGLSGSALMMILARAFQGIGASMMMSAGPALVTEAFPARERGKALGFIGSAVALGLLAGPLVGGLIVQYAGWRWMFFINIPVGLVLAGVIEKRVSGFDTSCGGRLDVPGAALMALSVATLVMGLFFGEALGWGSPASMTIFGAAVIFGAAFILLEQRVSNPLLDLALFRKPDFSIGAFAGWTNYAALMPVPVFIPFYLADLLHYQPHQIGPIIASGPITLAIVAPLAGALSDRIGPRILTTVGLLTVGGALLWMRTLTPESTWVQVVMRLACASFGSALFTSPNSSAVMGSVKRKDLGIASGTISLVRNLGMVSGVAIAGAIITTVKRGAYVSGELAGNGVEHVVFLQGLKSAYFACALIAFIGAAVSATRAPQTSEE